MAEIIDGNEHAENGSGSGSDGLNGFEVLDDTTTDEVDSTTDCSCKQVVETLRNNKALIDILYWRDYRKTGILFLFGLLVLLSLMWFSFISVVAYFGLSVLLASIGMRGYCRFMKCNSFSELQERELVLNREDIDKYVQQCLPHFNRAMDAVRRVLLLEDSALTTKVALGLVLLLLVGSCFDLLTLITIGHILLFLSPPIYERHHEQINSVLGQLLENAKAKLDQAKDAKKRLDKKQE